MVLEAFIYVCTLDIESFARGGVDVGDGRSVWKPDTHMKDFSGRLVGVMGNRERIGLNFRITL